MEKATASDGRRTFELLRPLCTRLLDVSSTSSEDRAAVLQSLHTVLREANSAELQRCSDYVLFPLLLLLDAAVVGRSSTSRDNEQRSGKSPLFRVGDKVAEGVLSCVEVVLQRCLLETTSQVTILLQKITSALVLSPAEAAEEFRHGAVKCLLALLQNLKPCDADMCACKLAATPPFVELAQNPLTFFANPTSGRTGLEEHFEAEISCPLGHLQSERMSAIVGHMISLLLQTADTEGARGTRGSGKLRRDALFTLRTLVMKVGTAEGVAFFLPGVVSSFTKIMLSSRVSKVDSRFPSALLHTSGAAGWPAAVEEAVKGITEIVVLALGDKDNPEAQSTEVCGVTSRLDEYVTASEALAVLQRQSLRHLSARDDQSLPPEGTRPQTSELKVIKPAEKQQAVARVSAEAANGRAVLPLRVLRTKEWLDDTASRVHTFLLQTFPLLCAHQSAHVRLAVAEAAAILLVACSSTLMSCTTLFLECLLALACDEWEHVASAAQVHLALLLRSFMEGRTSGHIAESLRQHEPQKMHSALVSISASILDQLPRLALSADVSAFVLHARRLAASMYYLGPDRVSEHLLDTLDAKRKFIQTLCQCLSFNTAFAGSLEDVLSRKPTLAGPVVSEVMPSQENLTKDSEASRETEQTSQADALPTMPPWLPHGNKIYQVVAYILRLAGLSAVTDRSGGAALMSFVELLLVNVRRAASNVSWYDDDAGFEESIASGQVTRMAATSVCVLNEIIYGASGAWNVNLFTELSDGISRKNLHKRSQGAQMSNDEQLSQTQEEISQRQPFGKFREFTSLQSLQSRWQGASENEVKDILGECAGNILHDFLAAEIWDQPINLSSGSLSKEGFSNGSLDLHHLQDNVMLQKVLVDGVGVLAISLDNAFEKNGFLGLALFPLLEKLASTNYHIRCAAAVSLNTLCLSCQYTSVRDLVAANVDLVIDSLCRQFRHLAMNPQAPDLLAAILRHTNASADLLPLLDEPLRSIVLELNVLSRRSHPQFTVPLLRALREITRATRAEAGVLLSRAVAAALVQKSLWEKESCRRNERAADEVIASAEPGMFSPDMDLEALFNQFVDRQKCRRAVVGIATSCLVACGPLLASEDAQPCLLALDTIEDCLFTLSDAEGAQVHEKIEKEHMERLFEIVGFVQTSDYFATKDSDDGTDSKKLLPSMNRIWPQLALCLQHAQTSVIVRAISVIASATLTCGGHFFTRRFQKDAVPNVVKLLREGSTTVHRKKPRSRALLMPQPNSAWPQEPAAPAAVLRVQEAVLQGISTIAANKESAVALVGSFGLVATWVILTACRMEALREVATTAVLALSEIDPDLVWILLMDLVHSGPNKLPYTKTPPAGFPGIEKIFPPYESPEEALWAQYVPYETDLAILNKNVAQELLMKLETRERISQLAELEC